MTRSTVFALALLYWHGFFWTSHTLLCLLTGLRLPTQHLTSRPFWVASLVMCCGVATVWRAS